MLTGQHVSCWHLDVLNKPGVVSVQGLVSNMAVRFPEAERLPTGPHAKRLEVSLPALYLHQPTLNVSFAQTQLSSANNNDPTAVNPFLLQWETAGIGPEPARMHRPCTICQCIISDTIGHLQSSYLFDRRIASVCHIQLNNLLCCGRVWQWRAAQ